MNRPYSVNMNANPHQIIGGAHSSVEHHPSVAYALRGPALPAFSRKREKVSSGSETDEGADTDAENGLVNCAHHEPKRRNAHQLSTSLVLVDCLVATCQCDSRDQYLLNVPIVPFALTR
jgi:hypothetical protein